jgi:hypothetical protein
MPGGDTSPGIALFVRLRRETIQPSDAPVPLHGSAMLDV